MASVIRSARERRLRRWVAAVLAVLIVTSVMVVGGVGGPRPAFAADQVLLGNTLAGYAVLAGQTVTNTVDPVDVTAINGDLGLYPGSAVTGFPPGVVNGTQHVADPTALAGQNELIQAFLDTNSVNNPTTTPVVAALDGQTLFPGVYESATSLLLNGGTVTLDGQGDPDAVFILRAGSTLITGPGSVVNLIGGANACNVFWRLGSSATLDTTTDFAGTILAATSASLLNLATVNGRVLAQTGSVTLDSNTITVPPNCDIAPPVAPPTTGAPQPTAEVVPSGFPATGMGGTAGSANGVMLAIAIVVLIGALAAMGLAIRRR